MRRRSLHFRRPLGALLACAASMLLAIAAPRAAHAAEPTQAELHFLYEVNRARNDPAAWALEYGLNTVVGGDGQYVTLRGVAPKPPLALNTTLVDSARFKAQELASYDYFAHQSQVAPTYYWPNELVRNVFGYPLATTVPAGGSSYYTISDNSNQVESLAAGYGGGATNYAIAANTVVGLIVDSGVPSLGHRVHLLATSAFTSAFVEAGPGYGYSAGATYRNYWAFHTGLRSTPQSWLTGVAYDDLNGNALFDPGEGLAGVTVSNGTLATITGSSGGYSIAVPDGTHTVTCSGGGFAGVSATVVEIDGANEAVDCISGEPIAYVAFSVPEAGSLAGAVAAWSALAALRARRSRVA
jgi:hypothetical protein